MAVKSKRSKEFAEKEKLVKKLNERIASVVRHAGTANDTYNLWVSKLTRPNTLFAARMARYEPSNVKLARNRAEGIGSAEYVALSRSTSDIEAMSLKDLQRLETQTKGWGAVKKEAKEAIRSQRQQGEPDTVTDRDVVDYLEQKETVREFIEGNSDAFYALIEATGWDDIREHTTKDVYNEVQKLDMRSYKFKNTLSEIGEAYIQRRDASREHRRALGIL